jgi:hypothetical protein
MPELRASRAAGYSVLAVAAAQGAIAVAYLPTWQMIAATVLLPLCHWLIGKLGARPG